MTLHAGSPEVSVDYHGNIRREIAPLLPARFGSVLEIGCASGGTLRWLRERQQIDYAAGVEYMEDAAIVARQTFDDVEAGDALAAPMAFKQERFDLVLALDVLEHLPTPDAMMLRLRDRLADGGTIIISVPNVAHYSVAWPLFFLGRFNYQDSGPLDRTHLRFFTERTARQMLEDAGLEIVGKTYNWGYPSPFAPFGVLNRKWLWYSRKAMGYLLVWPRRIFKYQFIIAARKI
jgi:SAM-dependent methyltransferase